MQDFGLSALKDRIAEELDGSADDPFALLSEPVAINSVNPEFPGITRSAVIGGETRCARRIGDFLGESGLETNVVAPDAERENLVAILRGEGGGRSLIINGHVDTVAAFKPASWRSGDPWRPVMEGGRLYGLAASHGELRVKG